MTRAAIADSEDSNQRSIDVSEQTKPLPYTILQARTVDGLIADVKRCLEMEAGRRWQVQGGVSAVQTPDGPLFVQAMVRR
jgi:hypothetical protein